MTEPYTTMKLDYPKYLTQFLVRNDLPQPQILCMFSVVRRRIPNRDLHVLFEASQVLLRHKQRDIGVSLSDTGYRGMVSTEFDTCFVGSNFGFVFNVVLRNKRRDLSFSFMAKPAKGLSEAKDLEWLWLPRHCFTNDPKNN